MKYDPKSRRLFLQGAGQLVLALPFLPSIMEKAYGQTMSTPPLRFLGIRSWYGFTPNNWYKNLNSQMEQIQTGVYGRQFSQLSNNGYINKIIANKFDSIKNKMSLVMGLDILSDNNEGHNDAAMLCASRTPEEGGPPNVPYSIDVIMENNAKIYPTAPKTRVLRLAPEYGSSFSWNKVNGKATRLPAQSSAQSVFSSLFGGTSGGGGSPTTKSDDQKKSLIIDSVLPDLNRLISSNKLSSADKNRVSNYADLVRDLQTRLNTMPPPTMECTNPTVRSASLMKQHYTNHIDIIVAALACGLTRVATLEIRHFEDSFNYDGTAFHNLTHQEDNAADADNLKYNNWIADRVAEAFIKLDAIREADGSTLLDNTIAFWGNELSARQNWHRLENMPVLIAGGGGKFRKGMVIDYRIRPFKYIAGRSDFAEMGRPYNELMISIMMAMGLSYTDWERDGNIGFGEYRVAQGSYYENQYGNLINTANRRSPLPYFYLG